MQAARGRDSTPLPPTAVPHHQANLSGLLGHYVCPGRPDLSEPAVFPNLQHSNEQANPSTGIFKLKKKTSKFCFFLGLEAYVVFLFLVRKVEAIAFPGKVTRRSCRGIFRRALQHSPICYAWLQGIISHNWTAATFKVTL